MIGPKRGVTVGQYLGCDTGPEMAALITLKMAGVPTATGEHGIVFVGGDGKIYEAEQFCSVDDASRELYFVDLELYELGHRPKLVTHLIDGGMRSGYPLPEGYTEFPFHSMYDFRSNTTTACEGRSECSYCEYIEEE